MHNNTLINVLGVVYEHLKTQDGGDLYITRYAKNFEKYIEKGVNPKRMKYVGLRRLFPLGGDPQFDRRVEILITYVKAP